MFNGVAVDPRRILKNELIAIVAIMLTRLRMEKLKKHIIIPVRSERSTRFSFKVLLTGSTFLSYLGHAMFGRCSAPWQDHSCAFRW